MSLLFQSLMAANNNNMPPGLDKEQVGTFKLISPFGFQSASSLCYHFKSIIPFGFALLGFDYLG